MVASSVSHAPCFHDSSFSNSRESTYSTLASCTDFVIKTEVCQDNAEPEASALHVQVVTSKLEPIEPVVPLLKVSKEDVAATDTSCPIEEDKLVKSAMEHESSSIVKRVRGSCRRKDRMAPPTKLSKRMTDAKTLACEGPKQALAHDSDFYQDWIGGSRDEVENEPWNILGWLTKGVKARLQRK